MKCLLTVAKYVGYVMSTTALIIVINAISVWVGITTARLLDLPELVGFAFYILLVAGFSGAAWGISECRSAP